MKQAVLIDYKSYRNDTEIGNTITEGSLESRADGSYVVEYDGSHMCGIDGTTMRIEIRKPDRFVLTLEHENLSMEHYMDNGRVTHCCTDRGGSFATLQLKHLKADLDENGGSVDASYQMSVNFSDVLTNRITMNITPDPYGKV